MNLALDSLSIWSVSSRCWRNCLSEVRMTVMYLSCSTCSWLDKATNLWANQNRGTSIFLSFFNFFFDTSSQTFSNLFLTFFGVQKLPGETHGNAWDGGGNGYSLGGLCSIDEDNLESLNVFTEGVGETIVFLRHVIEASLEVTESLVDALTVARHPLAVHDQLRWRCGKMGSDSSVGGAPDYNIFRIKIVVY